ncbi:MAG: hypothetical protein WA991_02110 [Ornithinimicrobium sp.]
MGGWGSTDAEGHMVDGGQGEYVRVPLADGALVATAKQPSDEQLPSLLTLTDVMCTGWHAARRAKITSGSTVGVVGDGADRAGAGAGRLAEWRRADHRHVAT